MATTSQQESNQDKQKEGGTFECNICLDTAKDAVVSLCGHLFCWPCLHQWLETRPTKQMCPVCKAAISRDKVIPLYGRGSSEQKDPRDSVPPRPPGQRTEPENNGAFGGLPGLGGDGSFHLSFGIGAFPFGFISSSFNLGDPRPGSAPRGSPQFEQENILSNVFLIVAFVFLFMLLFA